MFGISSSLHSWAGQNTAPAFPPEGVLHANCTAPYWIYQFLSKKLYSTASEARSACIWAPARGSLIMNISHSGVLPQMRISTRGSLACGMCCPLLDLSISQQNAKFYCSEDSYAYYERLPVTDAIMNLII